MRTAAILILACGGLNVMFVLAQIATGIDFAPAIYVMAFVIVVLATGLALAVLQSKVTDEDR